MTRSPGWKAAMAAVVLCLGCTPFARQSITFPKAAPPRNAEALSAAVERFFEATTADAIREAVRSARAAGPETADYHEIAAIMAEYEARHADQLTHLVKALLDPANKTPILQLHRLQAMDLTAEQRDTKLGLLEALSTRHPRPDVQSLAARFLAEELLERGETEESKAALKRAGTPLAFAVVGPLDNERGTGFGMAYGPEKTVNLKARYPGRTRPVGWRTDPPTDPFGVLDLEELMAPADWSMAYAACNVIARSMGALMLHVATTDPVKVWVNGDLVFSGRDVGGFAEDALRIPIRIFPGINRIVIKTAHETGPWKLMAHVSNQDGKPLGPELLVPTSVAEPHVSPRSEGLRTRDTGDLLGDLLERLPKGTDHTLFTWAAWTQRLGLFAQSAGYGDRLAKRNPDSISASHMLARSLWALGERGRASHLLERLDRACGDELISLRLLQIRYWTEQGFHQKARESLMALQAAHPRAVSVLLQSAAIYGRFGWDRDRCEALEAANRLRPDCARIEWELAGCLNDLGFADRARQLYLEILEALPNHLGSLLDLQQMERDRGDLDAAAERGRAAAEVGGHLRITWLSLAETLRRAGDFENAGTALQKLIGVAPVESRGYDRLARLLYQQGHAKKAIAYWRQALDLDPDNLRLALHLDYLDPEAPHPGQAEVPGETEIDAALASAKTMAPMPGADLVYLLDDEVTLLRPDGGATRFVTLVGHALNENGRDRLIRQQLMRPGRVRLIRAFAVGADGTRIGASSEGDREVRFQKLQKGMTTVLQYRVDSPPIHLPERHWYQRRWFQHPGEQGLRRRWVLWAPKGTRLSKFVQGNIAQQEKQVGDRVRWSWAVQDTPPFEQEPCQPTFGEAGWQVFLSTIPGWSAYMDSQQALFQDAFHHDEQVMAVAQELNGRAEEAQAKLDLIQQWVMENIRYQQDGDLFADRRRPWAAPVVMARGYGDCQDKAVLFITLAHLMGIEAHFALVRTRDLGPVQKEVPAGQFNHSMVYVPVQQGVAEERFLDPSADALDVRALRADCQGTEAQVLDPWNNQSTWREVLFQSAEMNTVTLNMTIQLRADGGAEGKVVLLSAGEAGAAIRKMARNQERLTQAMERLAAGLIPGATLTGISLFETADVRQPAKVRLSFKSSTFAHHEGGQLRVPFPSDWDLDREFVMESRRHPLLLGIYEVRSWNATFELPKGAKIRQGFNAKTVKSRCLLMSRTVHNRSDSVSVEQRFETRCERIPPEAYVDHRDAVYKMAQMNRDEMILTSR